MLRLSVDDACADDVRVADLCRKYEIQAVFYWPIEWHTLAYSKGYEPLTYIDAQNIASDFEIGAHTITHRHLTDLSFNEALYEIVGSKSALESMFNRRITKFSPPRGYSNPELTKAVNDLGMSQRLTKGEGLVHIHPNSGANDNKPWLDCVETDTREIWCHSWELNKYSLWEELEGFLSAYSHTKI